MKGFCREVRESDKDWVRSVAVEHWGGEFCVFLGRKFYLDKLPGYLVEEENGEKLGFITYEISGKCLEIMTLNAFEKFQGIGTQLLEKVLEVAKEKKCRKVIAVTTNDNIDALRFYQSRGFAIGKIHKDALEKDRKLKPSIPEIGDYGIPMRDAIVLEYLFKSD